MQAHASIVLSQFQFMLFTKAESVAFVMTSSNFSLLLGQKKRKSLVLSCTLTLQDQPKLTLFAKIRVVESELECQSLLKLFFDSSGRVMINLKSFSFKPPRQKNKAE